MWVDKCENSELCLCVMLWSSGSRRSEVCAERRSSTQLVGM